MSTEWMPLRRNDFEALAQARVQLHQGVQNVAAVGRKFLPKLKGDENASLVWFGDMKRLAGKWIEGSATFRSSLSFEDYSVHLVGKDYHSFASFPLQGKHHGQVLVWLEEQIAYLGLDTSQFALNLPYQLPAEVSKCGKPFETIAPEHLEELSRYFHNGDIITREVRNAFKSTEVRCWPKNFDITTRIIVNNTGNIDTSSYVTVGFSPGDEEYNEPYFYASPWPYPKVEALEKLTFGKWVDEHWVGAVLPASELLAQDDQYRTVRKFISECFNVLRKVMIY